jgi:hypothetical protein
MKPATDYREDHYPLLIEAAKTRGLYTSIDEINNDVIKSTAAKKETEQRLAAEQPLSSIQRRLFTILPGIASWYFIFAPKSWNQRKNEALKCQLIGSRNYLLVTLVFVVASLLYSNTPISSEEIFLVLFLAVLICGISLYLFYLKRKNNKIYNN